MPWCLHPFVLPSGLLFYSFHPSRLCKISCRKKLFHQLWPSFLVTDLKREEPLNSWIGKLKEEAEVRVEVRVIMVVRARDWHLGKEKPTKSQEKAKELRRMRQTQTKIEVEKNQFHFLFNSHKFYELPEIWRLELVCGGPQKSQTPHKD